MLIDNFESNCITDVSGRLKEVLPHNHLYLLVDGAFVNDIHKIICNDKKRILFEMLPSCSDEVKAVSPFLMEYDSNDRRHASLLTRCRGWPMLSVIETPENLDELHIRLAAWCVVDVDGMSFNFRFSDTRRLPSIFQTFTGEQRAHFVGPAVRWSYIHRDGSWRDLTLSLKHSTYVSTDNFHPTLTNLQFTELVNDSRADELLSIMAYRGDEPLCSHSQRWKSMVVALRVAAEMSDPNVDEWVIWFVKSKFSDSEAQAKTELDRWLDNSFNRGAADTLFA